MDAHELSESEAFDWIQKHGHERAGSRPATSPSRSSTAPLGPTRARPERPSGPIRARSTGNRRFLLIDGNSLTYRAFFALPTDLATASGQVTNAVFGFTSMLINILRDHPARAASRWPSTGPSPRSATSGSPTTRPAGPRRPTSSASRWAWSARSSRRLGITDHRPGRLRGRRHHRHPRHPGPRRRRRRHRRHRRPRRLPAGRGPPHQGPLQQAGRLRLRPLRRGRHRGAHRRPPRRSTCMYAAMRGDHVRQPARRPRGGGEDGRQAASTPTATSTASSPTSTSRRRSCARTWPATRSWSARTPIVMDARPRRASSSVDLDDLVDGRDRHRRGQAAVRVPRVPLAVRPPDRGARARTSAACSRPTCSRPRSSTPPRPRRSRPRSAGCRGDASVGRGRADSGPTAPLAGLAVVVDDPARLGRVGAGVDARRRRRSRARARSTCCARRRVAVHDAKVAARGAVGRRARPARSGRRHHPRRLPARPGRVELPPGRPAHPLRPARAARRRRRRPTASSTSRRRTGDDARAAVAGRGARCAGHGPARRPAARGHRRPGAAVAERRPRDAAGPGPGQDGGRRRRRRRRRADPAARPSHHRGRGAARRHHRGRRPPVQRQLHQADARGPVRRAGPHAGRRRRRRATPPTPRRWRRCGASTRSSTTSSATARSRSSARPTASRCCTTSRPTVASTPRSTRPWPAPAGSAPTTRTSTTSRCGPRWAGSSARHSCPADGYSLLVADYNQIELRCIAHLAEDPGLIDAFESGTDIHTETAARVFGVGARRGQARPAGQGQDGQLRPGLRHGGLRARRSGSTSPPRRRR